MNDPVQIRLDVKDVENLMDYAQRCAEDLLVAGRALHPGDDSVSIRHRDRATVEARWLLSALPALRVKYGVSRD